MQGGLRVAYAAGLVLCQLGSVSAADPPAIDAGSYERLVLNDGRTVFGVVLPPAAGSMVRLRGMAEGGWLFTVELPATAARIADRRPLPRREADALRAAIDAWADPAAAELRLLSEFVIDRSPGASESEAGPRVCRGPHVAVEAAADEATLRRVTLRAERALGTLRLLLGSRAKPPLPLRIRLCTSQVEYDAELERRGIHAAAGALYLFDEKRILCGADLARFEAAARELDARQRDLSDRQARLKADLVAWQRQWGRELQRLGADRDDVQRVFLAQKQQLESESVRIAGELRRVAREHARLLDEAAGQLLRALDHEVCHAYLEQWLLPRSRHAIPRWLHEGLAQVFAAGFQPDGSWRLDRLDGSLASALRSDTEAGAAWQARELAAAADARFVAAGPESSPDAQRHYRYAQALVHWLLEQRALATSGTLATALSRGTAAEPAGRMAEPADLLAALAGQPAEVVDAAWREWRMAAP